MRTSFRPRTRQRPSTGPDRHTRTNSHSHSHSRTPNRRRAVVVIPLAFAALLALTVAPLTAQEPTATEPWWSYTPLARPAVPVAPDTSHGDWAQNDIDRFVLAGLRVRGLAPSPAADRTTLIRRLTFDLTGLPPTPDEIAAFVADAAPDAYERLVERLLASPQYGVKWGRHWLDLVRYAETDSFERDNQKPEAWRYRDWVVDAFNADMPWGRFLATQLAGDERPEPTVADRIATGYYRLGIWDDEPTDPLQAIYDDFDGIVDTTARAMLGISMGCARCHDHKRDPISTRDYYSFLAFFENLQPYREPHGGTNLRPDHYTDRLPVDGAAAAHAAAQAAYEDQRAQLVEGLRRLGERIHADLRPAERVRLGAEADRALVASFDAEHTHPERLVDACGGDGGVVRGQVVPIEGYRGSGLRFDGDDRIELPLLVRDSFSITFRVRSTHRGRGRAEDTRWFTGDGLVDGEVPGIVRDFGIAWHSDGRVVAGVGDPETFVASPPGHADGRWHHVAFTRDRATGRVALYVDAALVGEAIGNRQPLDAPPRLVVGGLQPGGRGFRGDLDELRFYGRALSAGEVAAEALDLRGGIALGAALDRDARLQQLSRLRRPELETVRVLCAREKGAEPAASHVRVRGNARALGDEVAPAVPAVLQHLVRSTAIAPTPTADRRSSGRRTALAAWITAPDNPLTWRVLANRLWQHHFGRGLSRSPNDFGRLGELPTHPELLDWLACEVLAREQSLKAMHRLLVTSATYRMQCAVDDAAAAIDPQNDLFWRFPRRRLAAEEIRDAMLAVTGELNPSLGGPGVYPPMPAQVLATASRPDEAWGNSTPEEAARRSIYIHAKRSLLDPLLAAFDLADTDTSCPVRFSTVQPTQALILLNGDFAQQRARAFAERLAAAAGDLDDRLALGVRLAFGRAPAPGEVERLAALAADLQRDHGRTAEQALQRCCLLLLNANEFVYLD